MNAIIVEGGGLRGAFAAGVLDTFLATEEISFDLHLGTSAGAILLSSYLGKQPMRSISILKDPRTKTAFKRFSDFLKGGDFLDLELLFDIGEDIQPLDVEEIFSNPKKKFYATLSNVETGELEVCKPNRANLKSVIMATSALPLVVRKPIEIRNKKYLDGGITMPIPIQAAIDLGAKKILVVRSRPKGYRNDGRSSKLVARLMKRSMPKMAEALQSRADVYNHTAELIENPPEGIKIQQIQPSEPLSCSRLGGDDIDITRDYLLGIEMAKAYIAQTHREYRLENLNSKR